MRSLEMRLSIFVRNIVHWWHWLLMGGCRLLLLLVAFRAHSMATVSEISILVWRTHGRHCLLGPLQQVDRALLPKVAHESNSPDVWRCMTLRRLDGRHSPPFLSFHRAVGSVGGHTVPAQLLVFPAHFNLGFAHFYNPQPFKECIDLMFVYYLRYVKGWIEFEKKL